MGSINRILKVFAILDFQTHMYNSTFLYDVLTNHYCCAMSMKAPGGAYEITIGQGRNFPFLPLAMHSTTIMTPQQEEAVQMLMTLGTNHSERDVIC